ncbi:MAG: fibronectin type III domain-containing protein [Solirubrobacteraceae bacterium]|nr:fibronectin type III domain-containing protein [Solirubrobacteraceae bacterium]
MSLKSHEVRKLAVASLAALAALGAGASSAQAASKTLNYQCKYPILGTEPLSIAINLDIPATWERGEPTPPFGISAVATAAGDTSAGLALIDDLTSIEGVSTASSTVTLPEGGSLKVSVPINVEKYVIPTPTPDPLVLNASGSTPSLTFDEPGTATIKLDKLALNLTARDSFGDPIVLPPVTRDVDGVAVTPSDSDPGTFDVYCKLDAGQDTTLASFQITEGGGGGGGADTTPPTNPTVTATTTKNSATLSWSGATDNVGVAGYDVFNGSTKVSSVTGTTATVSGLSPDTSYTFRVVARDAAGNVSTGATVTAKTAADTGGGGGGSTGIVKYGYTLAGSTSVRTLTTGPLPLKGAIDAELTLATGAFSADLTLNDTVGRLTTLGFLPVTVKVGLVPSGKTTGTLLDGVLITNSLVRVKLKEIKLFGAIPIAGGNSCQTKQLSKIQLKSTQPEFSPLRGGPIAGTYAISDLNGCGPLNGFVSPLTAGGGNTINLTLTPKA